MSIKTLQLFRVAARTERCHNVPPVHKQAVGEHTFGMLGILKHIFPEASRNLMWVIIEHDVPEAVTGDTPSPMLHKYEWFKKGDAQAALDVIDEHKLHHADMMDPFEYKVYKYCDRMELAIFAVEEADTGNIKMLTLYYTVMRSLEKDRLTDLTPEALQLYDYIKTYVERYYGDMHERLNLMFHATPNK